MQVMSAHLAVNDERGDSDLGRIALVKFVRVRPRYLCDRRRVLS